MLQHLGLRNEQNIVATEMTIMQDSVATRTRTKMLSRQEKLVRDIKMKKQISIIVVTRKLWL